MIEIKTKLTKEVYFTFNKFHFFNMNKISRIIINIVAVFLIIYSLLNVNNFTDKHLFCLIVAVIAIIEFDTPILPWIFVNRLLKTDKRLLNTTCTYIFHNDYFEIKTSSGYNKTNYKDLYKWVETKNFYYLYINNRQAHIICKSDIKKEDQKKLSELITKSNIKILKK